MFAPLKNWPKVHRQIDSIPPFQGTVLGNDAEWDIRTDKPTILGLSDGERIVSVPWADGLPYFKHLSEKNFAWVLHNGLQADLPIFKEHGVVIDPHQVEDTIIWHWLTSPNLCKSKKKSSDDESERRGAGFMNLYSMCSIHTDAPNWKECRGELCEGPCPEHDPFGYCGLDAYWPVKALPSLKKLAMWRGVDRLYPLHRDLMVALAEMTSIGVQTDLEHTRRIREKFQESKLKYWNKETGEGMVRYAGGETVNLNSWQQIKKYFSSEHTITLKDTEEETIHKAASNNPDCLPMKILLEYKEAGDGPDRWLAPRYFDYKENCWVGYVHEDGTVHPHFGPFTSSGRLNSANPNFQNVEVRSELGKETRRAIVAREGFRWYKADYKAAEYRVFLYMAGHRDLPRDEDFHTWCGKLMGLKEDDPIVIRERGIRQAAKTITFGTIYCEGLSLVHPDDLRRGKIAGEVRMGARLVFPEWKFQDQVVTFTGINLARRAFGDASWANRKRSLEFTERFFGRFPGVRKFQMAITKQIERERAVRPPTGYNIPSYGFPEDRIKTAMAIYGSNPVAHFTKHAILRARDAGLGLRLQVHDELDFEEPTAQSPKKVEGLIREVMEFELPEMSGLILPTEISVGPNWTDVEEVK